VRALGIDVGVRKGLDLVCLDGDRTIVESARNVHVERVATLVGDIGPDVVAIDSPPAWARDGRSRTNERELRRYGISCFATPSDRRMAEHRFYEWMTVGFSTFRAIEPSFPRYVSGPVEGTAIEVFPYASAVALCGHLRPAGVRAHAWRRDVLRSRDVVVDDLSGPDQVDAALAALTGLLALEGTFTTLGDFDEGHVVLPVPALPAQAYALEQESG
jgi:predicted nuclease with RNAse H fold